MHWLQVIAPVLATLLVIVIAVLGVAFVSAVEAFQKIFGRDADADEPGRAKSDEAKPAKTSSVDEEQV